MDVAINSVAPNGDKADEHNNTNTSSTNGAVSSQDFKAEESRPVGSYPKTGIDVLIVGTGLAGLSAAIECTRKGHNVRILERYSTINVAGKMRDMLQPPLSPSDGRGRRYVLHGTQRHQVLQALARHGEGVR